MEIQQYEQLVRRARALLYFMDEESALENLRTDIDDEALLFLVMKGAKIFLRDGVSE